jgi:small subunit ribosomal protein S8
MVMTDPLADMLTRIRNASRARHDMIEIPSSNLNVNIAKILKDKGYIKNFRVIDDDKQGLLKVYLRYDDSGESMIHGIKRVSRPGLRRYCKASAVPKVLNGLGISILSTSKGVLTDDEARKDGVGGEILCEVW